MTAAQLRRFPLACGYDRRRSRHERGFQRAQQSQAKCVRDPTNSPPNKRGVDSPCRGSAATTYPAAFARASCVASQREHSGHGTDAIWEMSVSGPHPRGGCLEWEMDEFRDYYIPRSRHDPKILWVDDAEIVGDRITKVRPIPRNLSTQKTERRIGELGASCVALVVSDVSVHEAP